MDTLSKALAIFLIVYALLGIGRLFLHRDASARAVPVEQPAAP